MDGDIAEHWILALGHKNVQNHENYRSPRSISAFWMLLLSAAFSTAVGCHRSYYRLQADQEAYQLIDEKVLHSRENPQDLLRIEPDRRSRMFDTFDPDRQPMPIDDPISHRYMESVDGRRGYPLWHANGQTNTTESPDWWQFLPLDEDGVLVLDADTAVQLALLHSPDYQRQLEQLYLSALDVSSERFRFDTQFFGGAQTAYTTEGPDRGPGGSSSRLEVGTFSRGRRPLSIERSFATGADLVVGMANSIVWELSGDNTQSASTVLDFALVQPLLRGAGRDRILERLTLSERRLLANVRSFERYRRSFYVNITTGRNPEPGVQRSGGVFGVGLGGFSGLGGGFAGLGGGGGGGARFGGGVAQAGGYIGLLQTQLQIQNQEENVARLQDNLLLLEETLTELMTTIPADAEAIPRQLLQVAQAQQALLNGQTQLLSQRASYQSAVDAFLAELGLPPYICCRIEDPLLERFQLIDNVLRTRREALTEVRAVSGRANVDLLQFSQSGIDPQTGLPTRSMQWSPELAAAIGRLRARLAPLDRFREALTEDDLPQVRRDIEDLKASLAERRDHMTQLQALYQTERASICTLLGTPTLSEEIFNFQRVANLAEELEADLDRLATKLTVYEQRIDELFVVLDRFADPIKPDDLDETALADSVRTDVILASQDLLAELSEDVLSLQLIQARARTESVLLPEVQLTPEQAFEIARENRRDYANARASVVDSWRLIEFNADDLESSLDLTFSGDVRNGSDNPLDLRASTGRLRVGLQWDSPLTRLQERNTYRQSLIEFNQARRSYYQFEDGLWQVLRGQIRQLRTNQFNFELGRQAVRIAAGQIALNEDIRQLREARGLASGPTAARDTISALNDLLGAQNSLLNIWVNYEVVRRSLDLDLGTMELTAEGLWIDPGDMRAETLGACIGVGDEGMIFEPAPVEIETIEVGPASEAPVLDRLPLEPMTLPEPAKP